ncbi:unnamed protein product [Citrullus colocynthis]|uniref:Uncharacterized protein n=1 Tax=Citrullus colocynthis TaxID=252529 RepID=A0ABP0YME3_9ROSI
MCDLWLTAQLIGAKLELFHRASSLTLNIQHYCIFHTSEHRLLIFPLPKSASAPPLPLTFAGDSIAFTIAGIYIFFFFFFFFFFFWTVLFI